MSELAVTKKFFPIGYVARVTGLSTHVIRAWESRYGIVRPARTTKNRRLYSQIDLDRLCLLRKAVSKGHSISQLAGLSREALIQILSGPDFNQGITAVNSAEHAGEQFRVTCLDAVRDLDARLLDRTLNAARVKMSRLALLTGLIAPLLEEIGRLWADGSLKIIHEHLASSIIQGFLWDMLQSAKTEGHAPGMVIATPSGQACQLGALMASVVAADAGWRPYFFGPSLPAEEIAAAVERKNAGAVALSIAYQSDEDAMARELRQMQSTLPQRVNLYVGGRASGAYQELIEMVGGKCFDNLVDFAKTISGSGPKERFDV